MNTMLMAVFERTREFGMLMALGMGPAQVIGLVISEAAGLACVSLVLGAALGSPLLWYLQARGLDVGGKTGGVVTIAGVVVGHLWYGRQDFPAYIQAAIGLRVLPHFCLRSTPRGALLISDRPKHFTRSER